jgi:Domain of unknown function (DUF4184)
VTRPYLSGMPWIIPSHPAPALLLKAWKPAAFSGLGLVLGTVVPDLAFMLRLDNESQASHTFLGQIYVTVPLVLVLHGLTTGLVLPWLLPLLPDGPPLHLHALAATRPAQRLADWLRVAFSGWLGGLTHVALDGFTHGEHSGWAVPFLPALRTLVPLPGGMAPLHDVLHPVASVLLGMLALVLWARMATEGWLWAWRGESPRAVRPAAPETQRREAAWLLGGAAVGAIVAPALRPGAPPALAAELAMYGAIAFLLYGAVLGALSRPRHARRAAVKATQEPAGA